MRFFLIFIFSIITISKLNAQVSDSMPLQKDFKNAGEQEDYWAEKLFAEKYAKQTYKRFEGEIILVDRNHIRFGNKVLKAFFPPELKSIFTLGIFYPQIITGDSVYKKKSEDELSNMTITQKVFYNMAKNDTLFIGELEELKFLSKEPTIKRFRFWEYRKGFANPVVYFFELTNSSADKTTSLELFIKGASLSFVKKGGIII